MTLGASGGRKSRDGLPMPHKATVELLQFRATMDCVVRIAFYGRPTRHAIEQLIEHLRLAQEDYPNVDEATEVTP